MLRRAQWFDALGLRCSPAVLPRVPLRFLKSESWDSQLHTLRNDFQRMTDMGDTDVVRINARFAAQVGADGYTQGFLYLQRALSWVFGSDEMMLYWAFVRVLDMARPYGPLGKTMGGAPDLRWVLRHADPRLDGDLLLDMIGVRWGFIVFSQTFVQKEQLLAVWDLVVRDAGYVPCVMAALLSLVRFDDEDPMDRLMKTCDVQVDSVAVTASVVATARMIMLSRTRSPRGSAAPARR